MMITLDATSGIITAVNGVKVDLLVVLSITGNVTGHATAGITTVGGGHSLT